LWSLLYSLRSESKAEIVYSQKKLVIEHQRHYQHE
jgi:hypothetical protein